MGLDIVPESKLKQLLESSQENRNLEFKGPFAWQKTSSDIQERVIKGCIALSNTPSGGSLVVGIGEASNHTPVLQGLSESELQSFQDFESISGTINSYVFGSLDVQLVQGDYRGKTYVVFIVPEFEDEPAVVKKDSRFISVDNNGNEQACDGTVFKAGDVLSRSRKSPPKTLKVTDLEMRDLIRLALAKESKKRHDEGWIKTDDAGDFFREQVSDLNDE